MKYISTALLAMVLLTGCQFREVREKQLPDGTKCAYTYNKFSHNESEPNCDWSKK